MSISAKVIALALSFIAAFSSYAAPIDLNSYEKSFYSQHGEDGVLAEIMHLLEPSQRYFIELGANDKSIGHISYLLKMQGWNGLTLSRVYENSKLKNFLEYVTAGNVLDLLDKHNAFKEIYLLIIDMSYNDFYIWKAVAQKYHPVVVVIKYNPAHLPTEDKVVKYHPFYCGDGSDYYGASILALYNLGKANGYSLIYAEQAGGRLFFVRTDVLKSKNLFFKDMDDLEKLYRNPTHGTGPNGLYRKDTKEREYISSSDLLKS